MTNRDQHPAEARAQTTGDAKTSSRRATILDDNGACDILSITRSQLKTLRLRREVPHIRVGYRTVRYRLADLEAYIERQRVPATWEV